MKFLIVFVALFAVAIARPGPPSDDAHAETLRYDSDVHAEGFKFGFETSNGISHDADGVLKDSHDEHGELVVHGTYSYVDHDGHKYTVNYVADANGFQPEGEHLPRVDHH